MRKLSELVSRGETPVVSSEGDQAGRDEELVAETRTTFQYDGGGGAGPSEAEGSAEVLVDGDPAPIEPVPTSTESVTPNAFHPPTQPLRPTDQPDLDGSGGQRDDAQRPRVNGTRRERRCCGG